MLRDEDLWVAIVEGIVTETQAVSLRALANKRATGGDRMTDLCPRQSPYQFRPMSADDLPLVRDWLARPHVGEWWQDADEFAFVSGDLAHQDVAQFIVTMHQRPLGYLQCYNMSEWNAGFGPQPPGTRGIDQFIGEADLIGRGHGSTFIRQFTEGLLGSGTPRVVVDPSPANPRAIRAYGKAGFRRDLEVDTPDGRALLMVRNA